jgi:bisphosphoglycerate-independent phosphoglycerate mutase (AlkP superfamily)
MRRMYIHIYVYVRINIHLYINIYVYVCAQAEWLSKEGKTQFHTAETEKYAHVTFFFNGGCEQVSACVCVCVCLHACVCVYVCMHTSMCVHERILANSHTQAFEGEDRALVSSPNVATYDLSPEMSTDGVRDKVIGAIRAGEKSSTGKKPKYDFVMCNFAAPDMVGHTGVFDATVVAVEATDRAIGAIREVCVQEGWVLVVTSDHGNCERMLDAHGNPKTSHSCEVSCLFYACMRACVCVCVCVLSCVRVLTLSLCVHGVCVQPVPLYVAYPSEEVAAKHSFDPSYAPQAGLQDIAPTVLYLMGLSAPKEMTGKSVLISTK